jgi:hypothetical protein
MSWGNFPDWSKGLSSSLDPLLQPSSLSQTEPESESVNQPGNQLCSEWGWKLVTVTGQGTQKGIVRPDQEDAKEVGTIIGASREKREGIRGSKKVNCRRSWRQ